MWNCEIKSWRLYHDINIVENFHILASLLVILNPWGLEFPWSSYTPRNWDSPGAGNGNSSPILPYDWPDG